MLPGMKKAKAAMQQSGMDDKVLLRMDAVIGSMTPKERSKPELLNAKRKIRIAKGSGVQVQDVNKLIKMHQEMERAMKQIKKMGGLAGLGALFGKGGLGGGGMGGMGGPGGGLPLWAALVVCPVLAALPISRNCSRNKFSSLIERYSHVCFSASVAWRFQEAPLLQDRCRQQPRPARRRFPGAGWHAQPAAGQGR
jgi:hypothetical protein